MRRAAVRRFGERALRQRIALDVVRKLPNFPDKLARLRGELSDLRGELAQVTDEPFGFAGDLWKRPCGFIDSLERVAGKPQILRSQPVIGAIVRGSLAVAVSRFEATFSSDASAAPMRFRFSGVRIALTAAISSRASRTAPSALSLTVSRKEGFQRELRQAARAFGGGAVSWLSSSKCTYAIPVMPSIPSCA